jgi:hypothetical protein
MLLFAWNVEGVKRDRHLGIYSSPKDELVMAALGEPVKRSAMGRIGKNPARGEAAGDILRDSLVVRMVFGPVAGGDGRHLGEVNTLRGCDRAMCVRLIGRAIARAYHQDRDLLCRLGQALQLGNGRNLVVVWLSHGRFV